MLSRLTFSLHDLRDSLWYRPALMTLGAVMLAFIMLRIDDWAFRDTQLQTWWLFEGGSEGARGVLTAIAGTMMTVVTTAFSITMVTLQLSSSEYSPRILRGFTGDRGNQLVLGIFIATFVYCLLILRSVRSEDADPDRFVPSLSITVAILLALICIGALIYFFHHASRTIQVSVVLNSTVTETFRIIEHFLETQSNEKISERTKLLQERLPVAMELKARQPGYLRGVDDSRLVELAQKHDLLLTMHPHIGDHIFTGSPMLTIQRFTTPQREDEEDRNGDESISTRLQAAVTDVIGKTTSDENTHEKDEDEESEIEQLADTLRQTFTIGLERTLNEDVLFGFQQLADIGMRALSTGVNDPTTAMLCIDQLGEGLIRVQDASDQSTVAIDDDGVSRIIYPPTPFQIFLTISFSHVRQYASTDPFVCQHLIKVLGAVRNSTSTGMVRAALAEEARTIVEAHAATDPLPTDLERVRMEASWAYSET